MDRINIKKSLFGILITIILLTALINSAISEIKFNEKGEIISEDNKYDDLVIAERDNVREIAKYILGNFQQDREKLSKTKIEYDSSLQLIKLVDPDGRVLFEVPRGVYVQYSKNGISFSGNPKEVVTGKKNVEVKKEVTDPYDPFGGKITVIEVQEVDIKERSLIKFKGTVIDLNGATVTVTEKDSLTKIKVTNPGMVSINGQEFNSLRRGLFHINSNQEIQFADIVSDAKTVYVISYKGKNFQFNVNPGSNIIFDPLNKKITAAASTLSLNENAIEKFLVDSKGIITINLNENGDIVSLNILKEATFERGVTKFTSTKESFEIFLDGRDIQDYEGNAVSLTSDGMITKLKGFITAVDLDDGLTYEGLSQDAYVIFDHDTTNFNIVKGNAKIDNGRHEILFENGEMKLKVINSNQINPKSFSVSAKDNEGNSIQSNLDYSGDQGVYHITVYNKDGEKKVISVPLDIIKDSVDTKEVFENYVSREQQIDFLKSGIEQINKEIEGLEKGSKEWQRKVLEKIYAEKILRQFNGESLSQSITDLKDNLAQINDPKLKISAVNLLGELLTFEADSKKVPHKYKYTDRSLGESFEFEVVEGKITAFYRKDGKRFPVTLEKNVMLSELSLYELRPLFDKIYSNNGLFSVLQEGSSSSVVDLEQIGVSRTSPYYDEINQLYTEARKYFQEIKDYAVYISDKNLEAVTEINLARTRILEGSDVVVSELEKVLSKYNNPKIQSEAYRSISAALLSGNALANAETILSSLKKSIELDSSNVAARQNLAMIQQALLDSRISQYREEYGRISDDIFRIVGEGTRITWANKIHDALFMSVTNLYYLATRRDEEILRSQEKLFDETDLRLDGAIVMRDLLSNDIDLEKFYRLPETDRFLIISRFSNLDRIVSSDELRGYMDEAGIDMSNRNSLNEHINDLFEIIQRKRGPEVAERFFLDFQKAMYYSGAARYSLENDPALFMIAAKGASSDSISFKGEYSNSVFLGARTSEGIEQTGLDIGLNVADLAASFVLISGVTKLGVITAEGLGAGKSFAGLRAVLAPVESLSTKIIGENLAGTIVGFTGEIASQSIIYASLLAVNPTAAEIYGLASILGSSEGKKIGRTIEVIEDADGVKKLFIKAESSKAVKEIEKQLAESGDKIQVGTSIPEGFRSVVRADLKEVLEYQSKLMEQMASRPVGILSESSPELKLSELFSEQIIRTISGSLKDVSEDTLLFTGKGVLPPLEGAVEGGVKKIEFYIGQDLNKNDDWGIVHVVYRHMTGGEEHITRIRGGERPAGLFLETIVDSATEETHIVLMTPRDISERIENSLTIENGRIKPPRADSPNMIAIEYPGQNMYIVLEKTSDPNTLKFITSVPLQRPKNPDGSWAMSNAAWEKIKKGKYQSYEQTINGERRIIVVPE